MMALSLSVSIENRRTREDNLTILASTPCLKNEVLPLPSTREQKTYVAKKTSRMSVKLFKICCFKITILNNSQNHEIVTIQTQISTLNT